MIVGPWTRIEKLFRFRFALEGRRRGRLWDDRVTSKRVSGLWGGGFRDCRLATTSTASFRTALPISLSCGMVADALRSRYGHIYMYMLSMI